MTLSRDFHLPLSLTQDATGPTSSVAAAIRGAARSSGVDFQFLMAEAAQESGLKADAKAKTSSASGLFQFVESTWLDQMRRHGAKYGLGDLAAKIGVDSNGKPVVSDPAARAEILALRNDPRVSAALAGEYARSNKDEIERAIGRTSGRADLYLAHFLGAGGASQFLKAVDRDGSVAAADLLPEAAQSNRSVFYDRSGAARSVAEIYRSFSEKLDAAAAKAEPVASTTAAAPAAAVAGLGALRSNVLTSPVLAMFDVLALSALRLIGGERTDRKDQPSPL